jgi:U3-containing 90S pre-ribosomal complex subunit
MSSRKRNRSERKQKEALDSKRQRRRDERADRRKQNTEKLRLEKQSIDGVELRTLHEVSSKWTRNLVAKYLNKQMQLHATANFPADLKPLQLSPDNVVLLHTATSSSSSSSSVNKDGDGSRWPLDLQLFVDDVKSVLADGKWESIYCKPPRRAGSKGCPRLLIVAMSAPRAAEIFDALRESFHLRQTPVGKLFGRHFKVDSQLEFLKRSSVQIAVATPLRLLQLAKVYPNVFNRLQHVVIDTAPCKVKNFTIFEMQDAMSALFDLFHLHLFASFSKDSQPAKVVLL